VTFFGIRFLAAVLLAVVAASTIRLATGTPLPTASAGVVFVAIWILIEVGAWLYKRLV
jgi:hypothetical protein